MSELTEYQEALDEILATADLEKAITFLKKWYPGHPETPKSEDDALAFMAGIHKARIQRGIGVVESTKWLSERGLKTTIEF